MRNTHLGTFLVLACLGFNLSALAATKTWTGATSGAWATGTNWVGGAPVAGDFLVFPATGVTTFTTTNDFASGTQFPSITIQRGGYNFTGNAVRLNAPGLFYSPTADQTVPVSFAIHITAHEAGGLLISCVGATSVLTLNAGIDTSSSLQVQFSVDGSTTMSGDITGSGAVAKQGVGSLTLSGNNSHSGGTAVNAGTLSITTSTALGSTTSGTQVSDGATLQMNFLSIGAEALELQGAGVGGNGALVNTGILSSWAGAVNLFRDSTISSTGTNWLSLTGVVSGTGGITKVGTGRLVLSGTNTYFGGTTVNAGILTAADSSAFGSSSATIAVASGATVDLDGPVTVNRSLSLTGTGSGNTGALRSSSSSNTWSGTIALQGASNIGVTGSGGTLTVSGVISGAQAVTKVGAGTLVLTAANSYTGTTTLSAGTLIINGSQPNSNVVLGGTATSTLGGTGSIGNVTQTGSATINPGQNGPGILNTRNFAIASPSVFAPNINGATAGTGYDQVNVVGTVTLNNATFNPSIGFTPTGSETFTLINNDSNDAVVGTFNGMPQGHVLTISGKRYRLTYTGGSNGNDVQLQSLDLRRWDGGGTDNLWTTAANWNFDIAPLPGEALFFDFQGQGIIARPNPENDFAAGTSFRSIVVNEATYTLSGNRVALTEGITGDNVYLGGAITINLPVTLGAAQTFQNLASSSVTLVFGGAIDLNGHTLTIGGGSPVTVSGIISGSGGLTKTGLSTVLLTANNTYAGATRTGGSQLIINGSQPQSDVILDSSLLGLLGGTGSVGNISQISGSYINPGHNGPGTLNTRNVSIAAPSVFQVQIDHFLPGQYDQLNVVGSVALGNATLDLIFGYTPAGGENWTLINNDGTDAVVGTFDTLAEGAILTVGDARYRITYAGGTGNDVVLQALSSRVWTGAGSNDFWTTPQNWTYNVAPIAGDALHFPASSPIPFPQPPPRPNNDNNFAPGTSFRSIQISSGGYAITGNSIVLTEGLSATLSMFIAGSSFAPHITLGASQTFSSDLIGFTLSGNITMGAHNLTLGGNTLMTVSGVISGSGTITKTGVGQVTLSGANTFTGATAINAGTLVLEHAGALGSTSAGTTVATGAELDLNGAFNFLAEPLTLNGTGVIPTLGIRGPGALYARVGSGWTGPITLASDSSIGAADFLNVPGAIGGAFAVSTYGGTIRFFGNNTYSGRTHVETGTLLVGSNGLGASDGTAATGTRVAAEGSLVGGTDAVVATERLTLEGIPSGSRVSIGCNNGIDPCSWGGPVELAATARFGGGTFSGVISGAGGINKVGFNIVVSLFGNNVYTGATQIQTGTMGIYGSQPNSAVQVQSGATLRGSNQVGSITSTGGTVSAQTPPPAGPSVTLTANGGLTLDSASTLELHGNPDGSENDKLSVIGSVNAGNATLSFVTGSGVTAGTTYTILENDGTDPIVGVFANLPEGSTFGAGPEAFRITYVGGTGNDVVLTNVDSVTISAIVPVAGPSVGGTSVAMTGTGFQSGATVTFGGLAATNVSVNSATSITAVTPARTTRVTPATDGNVDVVVTSGGVSATLANGYRYQPFDPNSDQAITVADAVYLLNFLFGSGLAPLLSGDANGDGVINILDVFYVIHYVYTGGPLPQNTTL